MGKTNVESGNRITYKGRRWLVLVADEETFAIARERWSKRDKCYTGSYKHASFFSNDPSINTLEELKMEILVKNSEIPEE